MVVFRDTQHLTATFVHSLSDAWAGYFKAHRPRLQAAAAGKGSD